MRFTNTISISLVVFALTLLSGCSWMEYFMIYNISDTDITINYEVDELKNGEFGIFNIQPEYYPLYPNNRINWHKKDTLADTNPDQNNVEVILPANSAMLFGRLSNHKYTNYDQEFYNGRVFNLRNMTIFFDQKKLTIEKNTFDRYFKKEKGYIKCIIP